MNVALPHCTTPPLVLLHVETCPAQSLSVYTFTNFECLMISIKLFALGTPCKCRTIRFRFISSVSVGHVILSARSFTLYMMSARSWHMYNNFRTTVLYIAHLSPSCSTNDSVVGVLFTLGVITGFASSKPRIFITSGCTSDSLPPNILVPFAQSLCPRNKFCHLSSPFFL